VLATLGLIAVGMISTIWGPRLMGRTAWALPNDLWGTLIAAQRLSHLHLSGLYTQPTGLIAFPGAAVILIPVVALMDAAGIPLQPQTPQQPYPESWLLAGPYQIAISALVLFAIDFLAERQSVPRPRRALLAVASAVALWSVSVRWGHPEDAVAIGLLLYGIAALPYPEPWHGSYRWPAKAGWLAGAAIVVQPLVLLALPVIAVAVLSMGTPRQVAGFAVRAAVPSLVALGVVAAANWHATVTAVTSQPNFPAIDHPTPWTALAPHLSNGDVAAGPGRVLAIVFACGCAAAFAYRRRLIGNSGTDLLTELLWWVATALAMRCVFESVMVAYYVWPTLAVALLAAAGSWSRLVAASVVAAAVTFASQAPWRDPWGWWVLIVAGLALTLYCARLPLGIADRQAGLTVTRLP
jgi:hypothetical protein